MRAPYTRRHRAPTRSADADPSPKKFLAPPSDPPHVRPRYAAHTVHSGGADRIVDSPTRRRATFRVSGSKIYLQSYGSTGCACANLAFPPCGIGLKTAEIAFPKWPFLPIS